MDGKPLQSASVFMTSDETKGDMTNANGYFQFEIPYPSKLTVRMLGYHDKEINASATAIGYQLEVNENEIDPIDITQTVKSPNSKSNLFWWVLLGVGVSYAAYSYFKPEVQKVKM